MKHYYIFLIFALLCSCKYRTGVEPLTLSSEYTSSLEISKFGFRSSLLPKGKVLLSGSSSDGFSHEIYDPELRLWESLPNSPLSFEYHGLMPLQDGRILLAGGYQLENATASNREIGARVQLFDPTTNEWTSATAMNLKRAAFSLFSLSNGKVMAAGGQSPNETGRRPSVLTTAEVEFYDPTTDIWTAGPAMLSARSNYESVKLPDGRLLLLGGALNGFSGEIYNPTTNTWSAISAPSAEFFGGYRAALVDDDHVILTGGIHDGIEGRKITSIYTISEDSWKQAAYMQKERFEHSLVSLGDGRVIAIGGNGILNNHPFYPYIEATASCEAYDLKSDSWHIIGDLQIPREKHESILLSPTEILTIGRNPFTDNGAELQFLN